MRKRNFLILAVLVFSAARFAFAQEMKDPMMGQGKMDEGMMQMHSMMQMHGKMGRASMVSSNDGGVIVMIGNSLYKYDKNLVLVKQVELPTDMPQMNMMDKKDMGMMQQMNSGTAQKKGCSCGMGACGGGAASQTSQQTQTGNTASEHEAHH